MQKLTIIVFISVITASCGGVPPEQTVTKGGLVYKIRDSKPFSGTVAGYAREGYRARKLKYAKRYKKGILHGDTKFWYANGKLESIEPYTNGKINGIVTQYYQSGRLRARIHMVDGQRGGSKGEQFWREDKRETKDFSKRFFK